MVGVNLLSRFFGRVGGVPSCFCAWSESEDLISFAEFGLVGSGSSAGWPRMGLDWRMPAMAGGLHLDWGLAKTDGVNPSARWWMKARVMRSFYPTGMTELGSDTCSVCRSLENHVGASLRDSHFRGRSRVSVSERLSCMNNSQPLRGFMGLLRGESILRCRAWRLGYDGGQIPSFPRRGLGEDSLPRFIGCVHSRECYSR
jgi:hypothetical protein